MVDTAKLRGVIAERGHSLRSFAKIIGMNEKTFYDKIRKGIFNSNEMKCMVDELKIDNPVTIFFA